MMKDVYKVEISAKDYPISCTDLTIDLNKPIKTEKIIGNAKSRFDQFRRCSMDGL